MRIAIMQPKLMPYIGYWQLVNAVDIFVLFDDVNFVKKSFINHNSLLLNGQSYQFTLELLGASQNKLINEIEIGKNAKKILKTIEQNYKNAPYFEIVFPILEDIFNCEENNLARFIGFSFNLVSNYLRINTQFIYSSDVKKESHLKGQNKIIAICNILKANQYINMIGGKKLYDKELFDANNIKLQFLEANYVEYKQARNKFVPNLSIIDILMYNDKTNIKNMLENYKLIESVK